MTASVTGTMGLRMTLPDTKDAGDANGTQVQADVTNVQPTAADEIKLPAPTDVAATVPQIVAARPYIENLKISVYKIDGASEQALLGPQVTVRLRKAMVAMENGCAHENSVHLTAEPPFIRVMLTRPVREALETEMMKQLGEGYRVVITTDQPRTPNLENGIGAIQPPAAALPDLETPKE